MLPRPLLNHKSYAKPPIITPNILTRSDFSSTYKRLGWTKNPISARKSCSVSS